MPLRPVTHRSPRAAEWRALFAGLGTLSLLTTASSAWIGVTNPTIVALSFLLVVLVVAAISTRWVAITMSLTAFLFFNYFFLPPVKTWTIADPENWVALFTLLTVSIVASHLSVQARQRANEAAARRDELARLFDLTRDILLMTETADAVGLVARHIARRFGLASVTICLPGPDGWRRHHANERTPDIESARLESALAQTRFEPETHERTNAGHTRIETREGTSAWLVPLRVGTRPIGLLVLVDGHLEPGTRDAIAGVTAIAIDRAQLLEERKEAEVVRRGAQLKSALLASLSHDLKTPLTAVAVAANNLDASWLTDEQRRSQVDIVRSELRRLTRLFQDIVDMARIETDAIAAELEWVQPAEIVEAAVRQAEPALDGHRVEMNAPEQDVLVKLDPRLTSAALAHLLENAGQYSPRASAVTVSLALLPAELTIAVRDRGTGIATADLDHLFDRSFRGTAARGQRFGTGMGLAITRGLVAAQNGRVWAENHPDGGATFTIAIPVQSRTVVAIEGESR